MPIRTPARPMIRGGAPKTLPARPAAGSEIFCMGNHCISTMPAATGTFLAKTRRTLVSILQCGPESDERVIGQVVQASPAANVSRRAGIQCVVFFGRVTPHVIRAVPVS